ncbi:MAG: polyphosphate:AMP phosphotransferase, partial [Haliea sp.]|nr:polyphosphate:AMP phosphotransferase [Haliea sp.]
VEQFAAPQAWQRAYDEINQFEQQLQDHGCIVVKFWLHISPAEQLRRFQDRQNTPHKQHKITDDDWRNRARWADYESAVLDMVELTSTAAAPWTLVAGNDKRYARVQILQTLCAALEQGLSTQQ